MQPYPLLHQVEPTTQRLRVSVSPCDPTSPWQTPPSLGKGFQMPQQERFVAQLCEGMVPGGFYFISCYFHSGTGVEVYNKLLLRDVLGWVKAVGRPFRDGG